MDSKEICEILDKLSSIDFDIIEFEYEELTVKFEKKTKETVMVAAPLQNIVEELPVSNAVNEKLETEVESVVDDSIVMIDAPMIGTFYRSPEPGQDVFVKVGDTIVPGQPLCILEAMKLMNEVTAEISGVIIEILPENEDMVEFGQTIFKVKVS